MSQTEASLCHAFSRLDPRPRAPPPPQPIAGAPPWLTPLELMVLGAIWGASFLFMRVAAPEFGALPLVEVRLALGALILLPPVARPRAVQARAILPLVSFRRSTRRFRSCCSRGRPSVHPQASARSPMRRQCCSQRSWLPVLRRAHQQRRAVGCWRASSASRCLRAARPPAAACGARAAGTFAAFLYGIGGNLVRRQLAGLPSGAVAAGTLLCAACYSHRSRFSRGRGRRFRCTRGQPRSARRALHRHRVSHLFPADLSRRRDARVTVTYLIPLFGVVWAWILLGEPLTLTMAIAGPLISAAWPSASSANSGARPRNCAFRRGVS